jgi:integrase
MAEVIMKTIRNPNHPKKGQCITVEPIRDPKALAAISRMLSSQPRNLLLFTMGINNGLRTGDLLKLKVKDVCGLSVGSYINIRESKTGKTNVLVANQKVYDALSNFLPTCNLSDNDYLFKSRKGNGPLTIQAVNGHIKAWTREVGLKGNYGAHTLRKTWGYHQRKTYGVSFEIIARRFNHSNPEVTMRYLGIEDKEVHEILLNQIG